MIPATLTAILKASVKICLCLENLNKSTLSSVFYPLSCPFNGLFIYLLVGNMCSAFVDFLVEANDLFKKLNRLDKSDNVH